MSIPDESATVSPGYEDISAALSRAGADYSPAESHGLLCGSLAVNSTITATECVAEILAGVDLNAGSAVESREVLELLACSTRRQLDADGFGFELLLPLDDSPLLTRVAALAGWCRAFLFGMSFGGLSRDTALPADSAEIIQDIADIGGAHSPVVVADEDEFAYQELVEYLRVGVLLINGEVDVSTQGARRLH